MPGQRCGAGTVSACPSENPRETSSRYRTLNRKTQITCGFSAGSLGKISDMAGQIRVTNPLLDVLEVLLQAFDSRADDLHGWAIMKATKRSGPTVYGVLDRLEDIGWISGRWEDENPEPGKPRRRLYSITPTGVIDARELLRARRPQALRSRRWVPGSALPSGQHVAPKGGAM
jgi:PadR family transcriptional regulator PadR